MSADTSETERARRPHTTAYAIVKPVFIHARKSLKVEAAYYYLRTLEFLGSG